MAVSASLPAVVVQGVAAYGFHLDAGGFFRAYHDVARAKVDLQGTEKETPADYPSARAFGETHVGEPFARLPQEMDVADYELSALVEHFHRHGVPLGYLEYTEFL
jgi:hypothetical protein